MPRTKSQAFLLALTILVMSLHFHYVLSVSMSVPHQDEWSILNGMFQSLDTHRVAAWLIQPRNGHLMVFSKLGYLLSLFAFSLDLAPLRLLNFPICLAAFLLSAYVVNANVTSRATRFYLYPALAFIAFNLCLWEHFTEPGALSTILSAVLGGVSLYYVAKGLTDADKRKKNLSIAASALFASILSFGLGFIALVAAILIFALSLARKWARPWLAKGSQRILFFILTVLGLLAIASHPAFHLPGSLFHFVFHCCLVAGSIWAMPFDFPPMAQNAGLLFGTVVLLLSMWIGFDFIARKSSADLPHCFAFKPAAQFGRGEAGRNLARGW
jgi:hypothetical protein